jgi:hypothetical protein
MMADKQGRNKGTYWRRREDIERKPGKPRLAVLLIAALTVGVSWYSEVISNESDVRRTVAQIDSAEELARSKMEQEQFEKAVRKKLISKRDNLQIIIGQIRLEKSYALNQ